MFWILRRTGAANFFNSLNNNCSTSRGNNNSTQDKYVKRPPRKAYGRLSADSDDAASMKHKIDDPFDDLDNFEIIAPGGRAANGNSNGNGNGKAIANGYGTTQLNGCAHAGDDGGGGGGGGSGDGCGIGGCGIGATGGAAASGGGGICTSPDCQGNFVANGLCDLDMSNLCGGGGVGGGGASSGGLFKSHSLLQQRQKEINENTINRLQAMAMSDDDDYDESLTCNVCDRAFHCHRQLSSHQQKKRHFGCSACDSLFPSLMLLEHHKEEFEHWSDDEISRRICCRRNRGDDYFTDTDSFTSEAESEDLERLL